MLAALNPLAQAALAIGAALVVLQAAVSSVLLTQPDRGAPPRLVRELPGALAAAGVAALGFCVVTLLLTGTGTVSEYAVVAILACIAAFLSGAPDADDVHPDDRPRRTRAPITFPNYTQIPSRVPVRVWHVLRAGSIVGALVVVVLLVVAPATGLFVMWRVVIASLPLLFMVAPGLWRNLCPLAASNQTPRALGITRAEAPPAWLKEYGYVIAFSMFFCFVALRRLGMDHSGPFSALLLVGAMGGAFAGGVLLKGKSGWCSTICPLLPVQRIYGQTPLVTIANAHCQPCVGCVKNCYDFSPRAAYLADLNDSDSYWSGYRRFFVGAFPGLVLSFFQVPGGSVVHVLVGMALYVAVSTAIFAVLTTFVKTSLHVLTSLFGAVAFSIFYWFAGSFGPAPLDWAIRTGAIALAVTWFIRTIEKERPFFDRNGGGASAPTTTTTAPPTASPRPAGGRPSVTFLPGDKPVVAEPGVSLLEIAEGNDLAIEAGCRMGICGADPVAIKDGMSCAGTISDDEQATLDRLGLAENTRLACCVRPTGPIAVALEPDRAASARVSSRPEFPYDASVERVVVLGNGIAGVTGADHLRRRHPVTAIDLIAEEPHHLYNRMGISRLIYGRSAMQGLYLNPDAWYQDHEITTWLNTRALRIDRTTREVALGTGESLPYDRLILVTGSRSFVPPIEGFGVAGTGVLRSAADALAFRAHAQQVGARRGVVAGGGVLGLEAAYALRKLGMRTVVLERSGRLLRRQLDDRASELLRTHLEGLGVEIVLGAEVRAVEGDDRLRTIELVDGRRTQAEIMLVAAGIQPNIELARDAGLRVNRGVIVDDRMRTNDPRIYAAGDVAEFESQLPGLWPTAVGQAEVAAENAAGGDRAFAGVAPVTTLKVVGIELSSIGRVEATQPNDEAIAIEDPAARRYRKLIIADGRIVGAILLGVGSDVTAAVRTAVNRRLDVTSRLDELRAGRFEVLAQLGVT